MGFKWFTSPERRRGIPIPVIIQDSGRCFRFPAGFQKVKCSAARTPKLSEAGTSR